MSLPRLGILLLVFLTLIPAFRSQEPCKPPEIVFNRNTNNLFNEQQEMHLGSVVSEYFGTRYRIISDEEANQYVRVVGERLTNHLPHTSIKFRFHVVDLPELNAFAAVGGRIYITRKLIAFVRNEDELAGIVAHELGHGIARHGSQELSVYFRKILNVDQVGDRDDIYKKFHEFLDRQQTKTIETPRGHANDEQLEADRIGLFALIAAGYDPDAYASAWDRLAETKGKTGSSLSNLFGTTKPEQKRLHEIIKAAATIPPSCRKTVPQNRSSHGEFLKWQSYILTTSTFAKSSRQMGLVAKRQLTPDLRGDVKHFQFSPDGVHILAQDVSGINVLTREPFKYVFRIPATNAKFASFSPDSSTISFETYGLRVESWNVAKQTPILTTELYSRYGCWQSKLSPDGRSLVCYSRDGTLDIIDVATNEKIFTRPKFYVPSFFEIITWQYLLSDGTEKEIDAMQMEFSQDGKYFLGGRVFRFAKGGSASIAGLFTVSWGFDADQEAFIAYDFSARREVKLAGDLKPIVSAPFAFYDSTKLIGQDRKKPENSGIFTFPEGKRVEKFFMNSDSYTRPFRGDYLFVRPTVTNPVGVFDLKSKKFKMGNKTAALDGWGNIFVSEGNDGVVNLVRKDESTNEIHVLGSLELPKNDIGDVRASATSFDLSLLALSEESRGGIWDLKTGQMKKYVRGFRGAFFDSDGKAYVDLPRLQEQERAIAVLDVKTGADSTLHSVDTSRTRQYGKYLIRTVSKREEEAKRKATGKTPIDTPDPPKKPTFQFEGAFLTGIDVSSRYIAGGSIEVYDTASKKLLWTKEYLSEVPQFDIDPSSDKITMFWHLTTKAAQGVLNSRPDLAEQAKGMGVKTGDYLIQVIAASSGEIVQEMLVETGQGSFSIKRATAKGNWLAISDSENRIHLYSIDTKKLLWRYLGRKVILSPEKALAAIENVPGQIDVYDLTTGQKLTELFFPNEVVYAAFNSNGGMFGVVTADQTYYQMITAAFRNPI